MSAGSIPEDLPQYVIRVPYEGRVAVDVVLNTDDPYVGQRDYGCLQAWLETHPDMNELVERAYDLALGGAQPEVCDS